MFNSFIAFDEFEYFLFLPNKSNNWRDVGWPMSSRHYSPVLWSDGVRVSGRRLQMGNIQLPDKEAICFHQWLWYKQKRREEHTATNINLASHWPLSSRFSSNLRNLCYQEKDYMIKICSQWTRKLLDFVGLKNSVTFT